MPTKHATSENMDSSKVYGVREDTQGNVHSWTQVIHKTIYSTPFSIPRGKY